MTTRYVWDYCMGRGRAVVRLEGVYPCPLLWGYPRWAIRKYALSLVQAIVCAPLKNATWIQAFVDAGYYRGILDESQAQRSRKLRQSDQRLGSDIRFKSL